jgi:stearoyl-CoA desaturase (delta-9 desaturase)
MSTSKHTDLTTAATTQTRVLSTRIRSWFDSEAFGVEDAQTHPDKPDLVRALPFIGLHLGCLAVVAVGWSLTSVALAAILYAIRMFALTGFYHRYFSHRAFRTSRAVQTFFAVVGASCVQRGPLWWAAQHRHHHRHADTPEDLHSPREKGFWHSHVGWFLTPRAFPTEMARVAEWAEFPELRWLDRYDVAVPVLLGIVLYLGGELLKTSFPQTHTSGLQCLVWGLFVSTVVLFHATVTINSLAHRFGSRRFNTPDTSRNNWMLAVITFGEGWHNNHHFFPGSARQGLPWWEVDVTYYGLRALAAVGLVWDLKPYPAWVLARSEA